MSRIRQSNKTPFEDEALCRAYVFVSVDSINGANQTAERLWEVVVAKYHEEPGILIQRTSASLQSRFQLISQCVMFYVARLSHAMNSAGSGTNEMDWINEARASYAVEKKKHFLFDRCYQILKDHQRFSLNTTSSNTQRSRYGPTHSAGSSYNIGDDSFPNNIERPDENRPMGRNKAKLLKKMKEKEKSLASQNAQLERAEAFSQNYEQKLTTNEKNQKEMRRQIERLTECGEEEREMSIREEGRRTREIEIVEQRLKLDLEMMQREEERKDTAEEATLMTMDLSRISNQQRELYNHRIQQLLNRRYQNSQLSQNFSPNYYN